MSLPNRHLVSRRPAPRPPTVDPIDFGDLDVGDDTNPQLARRWDEPPTTHPPTQVARARRHATGTPVPAVPAPPAYAAPVRIDRRATPSPWEQSDARPQPSVSRPMPRASSPAPRAQSIAAPLPPPRAQQSIAAPLPRAQSIAAPLPRAQSIAAPLPPPPPPPAPQPQAQPAPQPQPQVDLPPELAAPVYGLIRRLALQTELAAADRVLRVGI